MADVAAATRVGWGETADAWSGAGADGAAEFMSAMADSAERLSLRIDELRAGAVDAADAVARAHSRLRDIVDRFEQRAAAIEARLDAPGAVDELREEARRALREATDVVDELRTELAGHASRVAAPAAPTGLPAGAPAGSPTAPAGIAPPIGFGAPVGAPGGTSSGLGPTQAELASLPLPDPEAFGEGVAVALPDGSTVKAPNPIAADAVRHALTQLGVPYVWGGTTPGVGLDCSGLTQWAYHQAGLDLPRLAQEQDLGAAVNQNALRPGDLAVWDGHVAMVVGNGQMIEAGDPVQTVCDPNHQRGSGFSGLLASDGVSVFVMPSRRQMNPSTAEPVHRRG